MAKNDIYLESKPRFEILDGLRGVAALMVVIFCFSAQNGEESGALDEILEKTADFYEEEADAAVKRLVGLLEPVMIIIMGGAIGLCLAGIFPLLYGGIGGLENS